MFERVLAPLLTRLLGDYVKDECFVPERVQVGVWSGACHGTLLLLYCSIGGRADLHSVRLKMWPSNDAFPVDVRVSCWAGLVLSMQVTLC